MLRRLLVAATIVALLFAVAHARMRLEGLERQRLPAELLYLPEGPYLRALALGHEETLADLLYIWAIQYYSSYRDAETRFRYLEQVFGGAITELDPWYTEVYLVGALVMSLEARDPTMALRLYDKGLAREDLPDRWKLAYWAGWECYMARRYDCARDYWARAREMPGAPAQLMRLAAATLAKAGDLERALAEYRRLLENPPDERTRLVAEHWVQRLEQEIALSAIERALVVYRERTGRCPRRLGDLVRAGDLERIPSLPGGGRLLYDPATCRVRTPSGASFGGDGS
ncbi:MAG: hypothetical protein Kow0062_09870 [Acidobacteriota bacterium]